jgi:hypothetical protein
MLYSFKDENAINIGASPTLAQGGDSDIGVFFANQEFALGVPTPNVVPRLADDGTIGAITFDSQDIPQGTLTLASYNAQQAADMEGLSVDDETDFTKVGLVGAANKTKKALSIMPVSKARSDDSSTLGQIIWEYTNWPSIEGTNLGRDSFSNQTAAAYRYQFVASRGSRWIWNADLTEELYGDTSAYSSNPLYFTYRLRVHYYRDDGSTAPQFTLAYKPVNKDLVKVYRTTTAGATTELTQSDTPTTASEFDVDISTGVVDVGAAGTADDVITVRYRYESLADAT